MKILINSWKQFRQNWYKLTLYQLLTALALTLYAWFFVNIVRDKMNLISELQPQLIGSLEVLEQNTNDLVAMEASQTIINSLSAATSQIIWVTVALLVGLFIIYVMGEGTVWRKVLETKQKKFYLKFGLVSLPFFIFLIIMLISNLKTEILAGIFALILLGWMQASYVKLKTSNVVDALTPKISSVLKGVIVLVLSLLLLAIAMGLGGLIIQNIWLMGILLIIAIEGCLFLKVILKNWI
jgi:hypothetical protein